ncbi:DUF3696 domain-containing protein [Parabacteroides gordonii]|uniref:DUF3696 domain-containing protein n=1 Tax=Parabacteroides gordonii TaxID=574930 RepID=UPI0026EDC38E|nr:DUF3696 domain-containing protein [Parabacteroides gordonii]
MLSQITIKNYKAFKESEILELRPITLLIGKNSSGKSSLCKLLPLLENATSGTIDTPLLLNNFHISLGSRFEDLFHNNITTDLQLGVVYDNGIKLSATYVMSEGNLMVYQYEAANGGQMKRESYTSEKMSLEQHFKGLVNERVFKELGINVNVLKFHVDYVGPMRVEASRTLAFEGYSSPETVGLKGENTYKILLNSYLQKDGLFAIVSDWMTKNMEGQKLNIAQTAPGVYSMYIERKGANVNIADVGFGLSQVLPIITQSYMTKGSDIAVIEQPVLHLHPAVHANVAYRLLETAKETGKKYLIESHSENFLLGLRKMVSDPSMDCNPEDVIIYFVDNDEEGAYLSSIEIDTNGELSSWPVGIFSESFDLMSDIMNNRK